MAVEMEMIGARLGEFHMVQTHQTVPCSFTVRGLAVAGH
jgi:ribosomal protein S19